MTRSVEPQPERDWSSRAGAQALAAEIKRFWANFGYSAVCGSNPAEAAANRCGP